MTFYSVVLFVHIVGALGLFVGLSLEWTSLMHLRRSTNGEQARPWVRICAMLPRLYLLSQTAIFFAGAYMAARMEAWDQGWIRISLLAFLLIAALFVVLTRQRMRAIRRASAEAGDRVSAALRNRLNDPLLLISVQIRTAIALGSCFS